MVRHAAGRFLFVNVGSAQNATHLREGVQRIGSAHFVQRLANTGAITSVLKHNINLFSTSTRFCPNRFAPRNLTNKRQRVLLFCTIFGSFFNTLSVFFAHQLPTLPQKIDSREGLFRCKKGLTCECNKMYFYLKRSSFAPVFGSFAAKYSAF